MNNPLRSDTSTSLGLLAARLPVGIVLMFAGLKKFAAPGGISHFVAQYTGRVPACMPPWFAGAYLHAVPFLEVALGLLLVLGLFTRLSGFLVALMMVSFGLAMGGWGAFVRLDADPPSHLFQSAAVYLAFALVALFAGPGRISLDQMFSGGAGASRSGARR